MIRRLHHLHRAYAISIVLLAIAAHPAVAGGLSAPQRELEAHAAQLGIAPPGRNSLARVRRAIVDRELELARAADPRNHAQLVSRLMQRFDQAQALAPAPLHVLFGFSRMIDAKATLSPHVLSHAAAKLIAGGLRRDALLELIDRGPAGGGWGVIDRPERLVAAIIRHQLVGEGKSLQLAISAEVGRWLEEVWRDTQTPLRRSTGGAANFGANLAATLPGVRVTFHSAQAISPEQAERFTPGVRVVTANSGPRGVPASEAADPSAPTKVNYSLEAPGNLAFSILGEDRLSVDGQVRRLTTPADDGRIILSTAASYPPVFDPKMGKTGLTALARENDLFVAVGLHYLANYEGAELASTAGRLRWQLGFMKRVNPRLYIHYQYVRARDPKKEWEVFRAVRGRIDSMSLNAVELDDLLANLDGHVLDPSSGPLHIPKLPVATRAEIEDPVRMEARGRALLDAMGLERLHLHGFDVDLILVRGGDAERMGREGLAAMKGRQAGVNKVVGESGEIRSPADHFRVLPTLSANGLRAVQRYADHVAARDRLPEAAREAIVVEGRYVPGPQGDSDRDRVAVSITPTRHFHANAGGLVSLGDTLDITTLVHAIKPAR
jgi:ADP-dependent phosphofructokinase/glucokinase